MAMRNTYYGINTSFRVFIRVGTKNSNVFVGRSQMLDYVYQEDLARAGEDEIHDLCGGTFLVRDGQAFEFDVRPLRASLSPEKATPLPVDKLFIMEPEERTDIASYR